MNNIIEHFLKWERLNAVKSLLENNKHVTIDGVLGGVRAFLINALFSKLCEDFVVVAESAEDAQRIYDELMTIGAESGDVFLFPCLEVLPDENISPSEDITAERYLLLKTIISRKKGNRIIVVPIQSLVAKTVSLDVLREAIMTLEVKEEMQLRRLCKGLVILGYERVDMVQYRGEFAARGGIVDIFNVAGEKPVRVELNENTIAQIKEFDISTQRSTANIDKEMIFPKNEYHMFHGISSGELLTLFDYLNRDRCRFFYMGKEGIVNKYENISKQFARHKRYFTGKKEFYQLLKSSRSCDLSLLALNRDIKDEQYYKLPISSVDKLKSTRQSLFLSLSEQQAKGYVHIVLFNNVGEQKRFCEYMEEKHVEFAPEKAISAYGYFKEGFIIDELKLTVVTDGDLFGRYKQRRLKPRFKRGSPISSVCDIKEGECIVHIDHGIGVYEGIEKVENKGLLRDYLVIRYDGNARLLVPVEQINLVQRYVGLESGKPKLNKLGSQQWLQTKLKVAKGIKDVAADLLQVQAAREMKKGFACASDIGWELEFEDAFIFEETPDQELAINDVKRDMQEKRPMDRLICGDVGYGKTEVAMRAAFKSVMNSKQVAVLVPTTILAEQHYNTFCERMAEYPVEIACLTRFNSDAETKNIIEYLKKGKIDIVIGTHKLLSAQVTFKDLGLVIIDEEQRFGVLQKEKLKQLKVTVDVITLSATPIPRTLYLSLSGAKDISVINTPPEDRLPIQTFITNLDDKIIRGAILRELNRGGQVYFVHNRVYNIEYYANRIRALVPEARVEIGHGQMHGRTLENVMKRFIEKNTDVLVCTTIIQSGMDIPNVNTILINSANNFGLADLYQLRGRVGRFKNRGYCYLFVTPNTVMNEDAAKRLRIIEEFTELGSGMKIALRDLEIRGAGNVLGTEQSGYIIQVGFELYCQLLEHTIKQMKGEKRLDTEVVLDLGMDIGIPSEYVTDSRQRIDMYRRLANIENEGQLQDIIHEIADRYGPMPDKCDMLFMASRIRIKARQKEVNYLGVEKGYLVVQHKGIRRRIPEMIGDIKSPREKMNRLICLTDSI